MKFEVRLRQGIRYCRYTAGPLNDWLVEQFIQGINNKAIAKKLLENERTMSLNEAVHIANAVLLIEAGSNGATASASASGSVSGVSHSEGPIKRTLGRVTTVKCFWCNREGPRASEKEKCRAVTQTCNTCGQKGHFSGARDLSLLHVQAAASRQNLEGVIKSRYSQCFKGVGKLKGCNITLHVDPQCEPVAQPVRRIPFGYKDKVTQLLES